MPKVKYRRPIQLHDELAHTPYMLRKLFINSFNKGFKKITVKSGQLGRFYVPTIILSEQFVPTIFGLILVAFGGSKLQREPAQP